MTIAGQNSSYHPADKSASEITPKICGDNAVGKKDPVSPTMVSVDLVRQKHCNWSWISET